MEEAAEPEAEEPEPLIEEAAQDEPALVEPEEEWTAETGETEPA